MDNSSEEKKGERNKRVGIRTETMSLGEAAKLEMASLSMKTPVSVLQELLSRRGITPKYELVQIEGVVHESIFRYRVFLSSDFVATGTGRSKKDAKHSAAKNLLDLLVGKQTQEQACECTEVTNPVDDNLMDNPIGRLQEACMQRRWPPPFYTTEHEEGLPHERQFTIACHVLEFQEFGTGNSKKLAKRIAARKMWKVLQSLPEEDRSFDFKEEEVVDGKMNTLTNASNNHKVPQAHKIFKEATGPKLDELANLNFDSSDDDYISILDDIAEEQSFNTNYYDIESLSHTGKHQCILHLATVPVSVCFGAGFSIKEAQNNAAKEALKYLKLLTKK